MAGLLNTERPEQGAAGTGAPAAPQRQAANQEEQAVYDQFIGNGLRLIHDKKGMQAMLQLIGSGNPVEGLANALVSVLTRLIDTSAANGVNLPKDVVLSGAPELFAEMADLAEEAGVHEFSKEELEASIALGMQLFVMQGQEAGQQGQQQPQGAPPQPGGGTGLLPQGMHRSA